MKLPASIQPLVDQILRELRLTDSRPSSITIDMDDAGVAHKVTPELTYRRESGNLTRKLESRP